MSRKQQKIQQEDVTSSAFERLSFLKVDDFSGTTANVVSTDRWLAQALKDDLTAVGVRKVQCKTQLTPQENVSKQADILPEKIEPPVEDAEEELAEQTEAATEETPAETEENAETIAETRKEKRKRLRAEKREKKREKKRSKKQKGEV